MRRPLPVLAALLALACGAPAAFDLGSLDLPPADSLPPPARAELAPLRGEVERLAADPEADPVELGTVLGRLGMLYQRYEMDAAAVSCFRAAGELDPDQPRWPYYTGYVLAEGGDLEGAVAAFERARTLDPEAWWTLLRLADAEQARGREERAEELYREVLARSPGAPAAHFGLGRAALTAGRVEEAAAHLEAALAAAPEATSVYHPLAQAYRRLGREEDARRALARGGGIAVPRRDPPIAELLGQEGGTGLLERAQEALRAGRREEAEALLRQAVERDPDEPVARFNLAVMLQNSGRRDEAESHYRTLLGLDPASTTARFNLATMLGEAGRLEEAVAELERVVGYAPDFKQARLNLATAQARLGRWDRAAAEYEEVARLDPDFADVRLLHASALVRAGRPREAAARLRDLVEEQPDRPALRVQEAAALAAAGDHREARRRLEAGLAAHSGSAELALALARLLAAAPDPGVRDPARAVELAGAVHSARPGLDTGRTLVLALAAAGRHGEAAAVQRGLIAAAQGAGGLDPALRRQLEAELASLEAGRTPVAAPGRP